MNATDPRSWLDKLVGACLSFLLAAVALYIGVQLIEAVWHVLLAIVAAATAALVVIGLLRRRSRGW